MSEWLACHFDTFSYRFPGGCKRRYRVLDNVLRLLILESISIREQLGNAIRIIVEKRRDVLDVFALQQILDIPAFALCF